MINEHCPDAIKTGEIKNHFGRKVAIDAGVGRPVSHDSLLIVLKVHVLVLVPGSRQIGRPTAYE